MSVLESDYLQQVVLPALFERLDQAFPEFGWRRDAKGWVASNDEFVKERFGGKASRVVAHAPFGFLPHGATATSWMHYVTGLQRQRGEDFKAGLRRLCELAGVKYPERDFTPEELAAQQKRQQKQSLHDDFWTIVTTKVPASAKAERAEYLAARDLDPAKTELGMCWSARDIAKQLRELGHDDEELVELGICLMTEDLGVCPNSKWDARVVGKVTTPRGAAHGFYLRTIYDIDPKYVNSRFDWKAVLANGLHEAGTDIVVVEGTIEPVIFRALGENRFTSVGGTLAKCSADWWQAIYRKGVRQITLWPDNDDAGIKGIDAALDNLKKVSTGLLGLSVYVVPPAAAGKDPDEVRQKAGLSKVIELIAGAEAWQSYRVRTTLERIKNGSQWTDKTRQAALAWSAAFSRELGDGWAAKTFVAPVVRELVPDLTLDELWDECEQLEEREEADRRKQRAERLVNEAASAIREGRLDAAVEIGEQLAVLPTQDQSRRAASPSVESYSMAGMLEDHEQFLAQYWGKEEPVIGLSPGVLPTMEDALLGLRGITVVPAPPGLGKSALCNQWGFECVKQFEDTFFVYLALEMRAGDHMSRTWHRLANLDYRTFRMGANRGVPSYEAFTPEQFARLSSAKRDMALYGRRIFLLDKHNFPNPTVAKVRRLIEKIKSDTGCTRCVLLVDYLQRWPVPAEVMRELRSDNEIDKWRMAQMELLVTREDDPVLIISQKRKADDGGAFGELAGIMGSATGSYTPDCALFMRKFTDEELWMHRYKYDKDSQLAMPKKGDELHRLCADMRAFMLERGVDFLKLKAVKGRDGMQRKEIAVCYYHELNYFTEDLWHPCEWGSGRAPERTGGTI